MAEPVWSTKDWSVEYKQIGQNDYMYKVVDPDGKAWHHRYEEWQYLRDISWPDALEQMRNMVRRCASKRAEEKAPVAVYTFFD